MRRARNLIAVAVLLAPAAQAAPVPPPAPPSATADETAALKHLKTLPLLDGWTFDPVGLVRTADSLRSLGKDRALAVLRSVRDREHGQRRSAEAIFLIVRALFKPDSPFTPPRLGTPEGPPADATLWPDFPLALQDGLPFLLVSGYHLRGLPEDPVATLDLCAAHCQLRPPISPGDDPLAAVDALIKHSPWLAAPEHARHRGLLRAQALRALGDIAAAAGASAAKPYDDAEWHQIRERLSRSRIHWDRGAARYQND